jgi:methionyl-tRNA formyltransferase
VAPILNREDGLIDFTRPASEIWNRLRGFQPWPGAFTNFRGKQLNIWAARPADAQPVPAELQVIGDRLLVGCGQGTALELLEVQPQGKRRMPARDFIHGYHPRTGEKLGG